MPEVTQGPWKAITPHDARKPITIETEWRHEGAIGGVVIATVHHHGTSRLQARKNARAIAVLPELLGTLEKLVPEYVINGEVAAFRDGNPVSDEVRALWLELAALLRRSERDE